MRKEKNSIKTDRAWNNVYARLEKEGLLTSRVNEPPTRTIVRKWSLTAAAAAVICIVLSVIYIGKKDTAEQLLITEHNQENSISLVTTLEDGSVVYLAGHTSLQYPQHFSPDKREVSLLGNALFDVAGNRARPFLIETEDARIEVIGTAFNIKSNNKKPFELSVQRGEVTVTLKRNGEQTRVKAGETVTLHSHTLHLSPTNDPAQFARYTERIRFKDEKLKNILRVINLQTPDIRLETVPALENRTLTVTFSDNSPEMMAELICRALKVKLQKADNVITLFE